jgi:hypothetical protein
MTFRLYNPTDLLRVTGITRGHEDDRVRHKATESLIDVNVLKSTFTKIMAKHFLSNFSVGQAQYDRALPWGIWLVTAQSIGFFCV